jgi:hypothetical protein
MVSTIQTKKKNFFIKASPILRSLPGLSKKEAFLVMITSIPPKHHCPAKKLNCLHCRWFAIRLQNTYLLEQIKEGNANQQIPIPSYTFDANAFGFDNHHVPKSHCIINLPGISVDEEDPLPDHMLLHPLVQPGNLRVRGLAILLHFLFPLQNVSPVDRIHRSQLLIRNWC